MYSEQCTHLTTMMWGQGASACLVVPTGKGEGLPGPLLWSDFPHHCCTRQQPLTAGAGMGGMPRGRYSTCEQRATV